MELGLTSISLNVSANSFTNTENFADKITVTGISKNPIVRDANMLAHFMEYKTVVCQNYLQSK